MSRSHAISGTEPGAEPCLHESRVPTTYDHAAISVHDTRDHPSMMVQPWYRSMKFLAAIAVLVALLLLLTYLRRKRRAMSRINRSLDERLAERTRLARDLNDTFLQTVEASRLLAENALSKYNDVSEMRLALEKLSQWLGRATEEGKSALDTLRGSIE
jgi:signal transduction histidine kinase